jgi:hypothetical protein
VVDRVFEFLFKYRPTVFEAGDFAFGITGRLSVVLITAAVIGVPAVLTYAAVRAHSTARDRVILVTLRSAAIALLLFCLFRPMLLLSEAVPQRNFVGVLIDDSRSMRVTDAEGRSRAEVAQALLSPDSSLLADLRKRFQVRLYRFGSSANRIDDVSELTFAEAQSRLGDAIEQSREELSSVPLSGLVVISDGADNSATPFGERLLAMRARGVPVFTVGTGSEQIERDVEIRQVAIPRTTVEGSAFVADVIVRQRGFAGLRVPVVVESNGAVVAREEVTLPADGTDAPVRIRVTPAGRGPHQLVFRVPLQERESITENNERAALLDVQRRRDKVLYVEGEPRYEVRFVRDAVDADSAVQLVVLQPTGENKFLRLNVDDGSELATGFPTTRAELFQYRAVVLGSIEASYFTHEQLQNLADFVGLRGGGILFLGGRASFSEGGYAGTPLADVMPVVVEERAPTDTFFTELVARLTPAGSANAVTQLAAQPAAGAKVAPIVSVPVTSVNRLGRVKPGASVLLEGTAPATGTSVRGYTQPILAWQRFGRGVAVALPVQDSWMWHMHADVPVEDPTYRSFWRQLLRWVTNDAPSRIAVATEESVVPPGGTVVLRADVTDSADTPLGDAVVNATMISPSGAEREIRMEWSVERDGEYQARLAVEETGVHTLRVTATTRSGDVLIDSAFIATNTNGTEMFDAGMRSSLLRRMAQETGGRFYEPSDVSSLAEDLALSKRGVTVVKEMDLWDMPLVFIIVVTLVSTEWFYRKRRGLA